MNDSLLEDRIVQLLEQNDALAEENQDLAERLMGLKEGYGERAREVEELRRQLAEHKAGR